jgi:polysaccharide biosynthesis/export protein
MRSDVLRFVTKTNKIVSARSSGHRGRWLADFLPRSRGIVAIVVAIMSNLTLLGCTLPRSGPLLGEVNTANEQSDILLVPVTPEIALAGREEKRANFPAVFISAPEVDYEKLAAGDGVNVTIWEKDSLGMFPAGPNGISDLGEMVVDKAGSIYLPYVGKVSAAGLTAAQLRDVITRRLSRVVLAPDVSVRITERRGQIVTVQGDLAKPGSYPIGQGTQRLSGLLSLAAPNQENPEQLMITVRRNGIAGSIRLSDLYSNAAEDIALRPSDSIIVHAIVDHLTVLGATAGQGRVKLTKRNYSVVDALGDSRGLNDSTANPHAVFLFRSRSISGALTPDPRPTIYQFDFSRPEQVALASEFAVRDGDAIYISDAPFAQIQKVLSSFSATLSTAGSVAR